MKPAEFRYLTVGSRPSLGLGRRGVVGVSTGKGALRLPGLILPRADNGALPAQPTNVQPHVKSRGQNAFSRRLRGPFLLPRLAPVSTRTGSLGPARSLLLPFSAFTL